MATLVNEARLTDEDREKKYDVYLTDQPFMKTVKRHVTNSSEPSCNDTFLERFKQNISYRNELSKK